MGSEGMKRSDELRKQGLEVAKNVQEEIGKVPSPELALALAIGSFAMLTDIAASLADIAETLDGKEK
jgi:hypothetical protein